MKRYLTTLEFSKATGIAQGTLRRWNAEGVLIPAQANGRGKPALYSEEQLQADAVKNFKPRALTKQAEPTDLSLADRVNCIRKLTGDTARNLIEIGRHLAAAKNEVGHGNWANWLDENFQWTERTAQNLMAVAERFGDMDIANFKPSHLQALLALPSGDEQKFIAEQAAAGQPVETQSARQLRAAVKQYKRKENPAPVIAVDVARLREEFNAAAGRLLAVSGAHLTADSDVDSPAVIDVDAVITPADALTIQEADSEVDSPADETVDTPAPVNEIDSELADNDANRNDETVGGLVDVFKLILEVNDADKLRRIRDFTDARLAALEGKKNKPANAAASQKTYE